MSDRRDEAGLVKRFCDLLGRQHGAAWLLDWIAGWLVRRPLRPAFAGTWMPPAGTAPEPLPPEFAGPLVVWAGAADQEHRRYDVSLDGTPWKAPRTPWRAHDAKEECNDDRYRGMHGTPCKLEPGGTDIMCPPQAIAGWFWKYEVSGETYYYVDCCGLPKHSKVNCNWSKEFNWCSIGTSGLLREHAYTCTLSLKRSDFSVGTDAKGRQYIDGVEQGWSDATRKAVEDARKK
jgi:hypothetical protein